MKLSVIALDYDGTIAANGRAHPRALSTIREVRSRGMESNADAAPKILGAIRKLELPLALSSTAGAS